MATCKQKNFQEFPLSNLFFVLFRINILMTDNHLKLPIIIPETHAKIKTKVIASDLIDNSIQLEKNMAQMMTPNRNPPIQKP